MHIFNFSNKSDKEQLREWFQKYFLRRSFIPLIGSGFTKGSSARVGVVPSSEELKAKLVEMIAKMETYTKDDCEEINFHTLSDVAEIFWQSLDKQHDNIIKNEFTLFMEERFFSVHDLEEEKKSFLNSSWRYLYTLNYDDAIEKAINNIVPVVPFMQHNIAWLSKERCVYKLHGDVHQYLKTGDKKYCILSQRQYLSALTDEQNADMLINLETDFSSNNLIFIGCSLENEIDILFAAGTSFAEKKKSNMDTHIYYVHYIEAETTIMTKVQQNKLEQYGITDVIQVSGKDMLEFYSFVSAVSKHADSLRSTNRMADFIGLSFTQLEPSNRRNIDYLFYTQFIIPDMTTKTITLPSYFVRRKEAQQVIDNIKQQNGNIHIIRGSRLSGKTYIITDILKEFNSRNIYYFYEGIEVSYSLFQELILLKNSILLFDEQTLNMEQIKLFTESYILELEKNQTQVVIAINRSNGMFTRHYFDNASYLQDRVKIYTINEGLTNTLGIKEIDIFNNKFGQLGIINYKEKMSFLDYMLCVDDVSLNMEHRPTLPDINILSEEDVKKLKALIIFANQATIYMSQANLMGIDDALYELSRTVGTVVQKDYLLEVELTNYSHDSFRFIRNSVYWVYRCLSRFATNPSRYDLIAQVYVDIVKTIQKQYRYNKDKYMPKRYYQALKPYYFLDTIQFTFLSTTKQGGSLELPYKIYNKLLPLLKDDYQFIHQNAKCLLRLSRREDDKSNKLKYLNMAYQQIARAYDLADERKSLNIEYTLFHMLVTKTLILINSWRHCREMVSPEEEGKQLHMILESLYEMLCNIKDEIDEQEMKDIRWFIYDLVSGDTRKNVTRSDKDLTTSLITCWMQYNRKPSV